MKTNKLIHNLAIYATLIILLICQTSCEKVKVSSTTNPAVKPDLNTYISYDIEGTKVTYSDTGYYRLIRFAQYDFVTDLSGISNISSNGTPPGLNANPNKLLPFPHFGLILRLANFSSITENQIILTDSISKYSFSNIYSSNIVSIFKKSKAYFNSVNGIDTTAIVYEGGEFVNYAPHFSLESIGDWKPSYKAGKIKITKIEDFKVTSLGLTRNYRMITGEITGNLRKYRQGFIGTDGSLPKYLKNYFLGTVPVSVKFRLAVVS